jgi:hypothetical protein
VGDMQDFIDLINNNMAEEGLSIRSLERKIGSIFKSEARVSKSLINLYQRRLAIPTYNAGYQLAVALGIDVKRALKALYEYRIESNKESELREYRKMLSSLQR